MSRTYRNAKNHYTPRGVYDPRWIVDYTFGPGWVVHLTHRRATKKEVALATKDGSTFNPGNHSYWYSQTNRVRRAEERALCQKALIEDLEEFWFNDSHSTRFRKGILWTIY